MASSPASLRSCAFYVAANGYSAEATALVPTCSELARDGGDESLLRALLVHDSRAPGPGLVAMRPRIIAAARAGSFDRVMELIDAGADVRTRNGYGFTALMAAAECGREAVVRGLLSLDEIDGVFVAVRAAADDVACCDDKAVGHSAFSLACMVAADVHRKFSEGERAAAAACARVLASRVGLADLGGKNRAALAWASQARLLDVVSKWLADPRTAEVVARRDIDGHSAFSKACRQVRSSRLSEGERAAAAACVRALAGSPHLNPGDLGGNDGSTLLWACEAHLADVVGTLMADSRCTAAVMALHNTRGHSVFSKACFWARDLECKLSEGERAAATACATALAHSPHIKPECIVDSDDSSALLWACRARLAAVLSGWLALPSCTRAVLTEQDSSGESPFSAACAAARDPCRQLLPTERTSAAACARAITASPHTRPGDLGERGGSTLLWACWAGLPDVVTALLASARCTRAVITARDNDRESPFSVACAWAGDARRVLTVSERNAAAACAQALAASPHLWPSDTTGAGRTALLSASGAGLAAVVSVWLADPRCTENVVLRSDRWGVTACSALLERAEMSALLSSDERHDTAACARALGGSKHVTAAGSAKLFAAALACEAAGVVEGPATQ